VTKEYFMRRPIWIVTVVALVSGWAMFPGLATVVGANVTQDRLEGRPAPPLDTRAHLGPRVPAITELQGRVVVLFFWAHWCSECKAISPVIAHALEKYRSQGLVLIAPTQRYGYVTAGHFAPPDQELRYIVQVRDRYYPFLKREPVPTNEVNAERYGVDGVPKIVLIDRRGIVRVDHSGRMTEEDLEAAIRKLL